jgi:DNA replication protein DnaC
MTTIQCYDPANPDQACPVCQGMGVIKYAVEPGDARFGKLFRCPNNPLEGDYDHQLRMRRLSNLDAFTDRTFENFELEIPGYTQQETQVLRVACNTARKFARDLDGWLLLEGSYGTGKTHLAAAIGNVRLSRGDQVLFITTPDLLDHLRSTFSPNSETGYDEMFERVRNTGLLILDDLGVENPSEWAKEKLFQLLNHRYTRRMATVITTNVDLDTLDPRIRSRLLDLNVIHRVSMMVPDYRNNTPNQRGQLLSRLPMYANMTFETFDVHHKATAEEQQKLNHAAHSAYQYAQNPENWLLFTGDFGTGKTHLAAAVANYRRNVHREDVMFLTVPDLLDYLRTTFAPDSPVTFDKLFDQVRNVPLLVLDDLGTESVKSWAQEKLFQILDYRYVGQMPTIITMAKEMSEISPRILSRLLDPRICKIIEIRMQGYALRMKRR